ncbi:hypothetical protein PoB_003303600 [Plakobranchus ocellatus]|uniref:Uncharacterized protein n=1 Tax=Plakobranchus ocellatus TaxID=259542 RepID=A0AAV4ADY8_9GAST|nr:hypothetical protein PoB_003303600 [Plakobranchus ocellatus]
MRIWVCIDRLQQSDLRFSGPLSGRGAGGETRTYNRRVPSPQTSRRVRYPMCHHPHPQTKYSDKSKVGPTLSPSIGEPGIGFWLFLAYKAL